MVVVFAIIGKSEPLYEAEIVPAGPGEEELAYLHQFILHASLDMVQSATWSNNSTFLRVVDRFNSLLVSAFITPGGTVMLLLHNGRAPEESVRSFFTEASELFAKHIMNPFAIIDAPMTLTNGCSPLFDESIRSLAKRTLLL